MCIESCLLSPHLKTWSRRKWERKLLKRFLNEGAKGIESCELQWDELESHEWKGPLLS